MSGKAARRGVQVTQVQDVLPATVRNGPGTCTDIRTYRALARGERIATGRGEREEHRTGVGVYS